MFFIQHGWGNGSSGGNITRAIRAGASSGVIWSPCNYSVTTLAAEIKRNNGAEQMVDPQLYVAYAPGKTKELQLRHHPWISITRKGGQRANINAALLRSVVAEALTFQRDRPELTAMVSPALGTSAPTGGPLAGLVLCARESIAWWRQNGDKRPLLVSLPLEGAIFDSDQSVHSLMGAFAAIKPDGFYLLAELDPNLDASTYASRLERVLWLTSRLSERAVVRVGYTGLNGWLFRAAGAEAVAGGWFQNRRWWSLRHWLDRTGGSRLERAALESVIALLPPADLAAIRDASLPVFQRVVAGVGPLAAAVRKSPARAGDVISLDDHADQMFAVCSALDGRTGSGFQADAKRILADLTLADTLRNQVAVAAVTIAGAASDARPTEWETALRRLAKRLKVQL